MPEQKRALPVEMAGCGQRLKDAREAAGMSQSDLAAASGVTQSRISRIESGKRMDGIAASFFVDLARSLGVRAGWLLSGEAPRHPKPVVALEAGAVAAEVISALREEIRMATGAEPRLILGSGEKKSSSRRASDPAVRPYGNANKKR